MRMTRSSRRNRSGLNSGTAKPKSLNEVTMREALAGFTATQTSRSAVARGYPWNATACPPITRYSTPRAFKHCKNSLKSLVNDFGSIVQLAEHFDVLEPFHRCPGKPVGAVLTLRLGVSRDLKRGSIHVEQICF